MNIRVLIRVILITLAIHSTGYANSNEAHSSKSEPAELWRGATLGMSPLEVIQLFPDARLQKDGKLNNLELVRKVRISNHTILSEEFSVSFDFLDNSLERVVLVRFFPSRNLGSNIRLSLAKKYGKPKGVSHVESEKIIVNWIEKDKDIELQYFDKPDAGLLVVLYKNSIADAASSL